MGAVRSAHTRRIPAILGLLGLLGLGVAAPASAQTTSFGYRTLFGAESLQHVGRLAAADFDQDGHLDVVVARNGTYAVVLYHNNGDGTFDAGTSYSLPWFVSPPLVGLAVGDFNGD